MFFKRVHLVREMMEERLETVAKTVDLEAADLRVVVELLVGTMMTTVLVEMPRNHPELLVEGLEVVLTVILVALAEDQTNGVE